MRNVWHAGLFACARVFLCACLFVAFIDGSCLTILFICSTATPSINRLGGWLLTCSNHDLSSQSGVHAHLWRKQILLPTISTIFCVEGTLWTFTNFRHFSWNFILFVLFIERLKRNSLWYRRVYWTYFSATWSTASAVRWEYCILMFRCNWFWWCVCPHLWVPDSPVVAVLHALLNHASVHTAKGGLCLALCHGPVSLTLVLFRFAHYFDRLVDGEYVQMRNLTKAYGILFQVNIKGEVMLWKSILAWLKK